MTVAVRQLKQINNSGNIFFEHFPLNWNDIWMYKINKNSLRRLFGGPFFTGHFTHLNSLSDVAEVKLRYYQRIFITQISTLFASWKKSGYYLSCFTGAMTFALTDFESQFIVLASMWFLYMNSLQSITVNCRFLCYERFFFITRLYFFVLKLSLDTE